MMDALSLLHTRNSAPKLSEPAPQGKILEDILSAALRSPDHMRLRPWRFLTITGDNRKQLGEIYAQAAQQRKNAAGEDSCTEQELEKFRQQPLRAPLLVIVIANVKDHPKVPPIEQLISAGCAAHAILLAAQAHGFAGIWRTGDNAYDDKVKEAMGLSVSEQIVGFLYIGTITGAYKPLANMQLEDFCETWPKNDG